MKMKLAQRFETKARALSDWRKNETERLSKVDGQELAEKLVSSREKNGNASVVFVPDAQAIAQGIESGWWTYQYC